MGLLAIPGKPGLAWVCMDGWVSVRIRNDFLDTFPSPRGSWWLCPHYFSLFWRLLLKLSSDIFLQFVCSLVGL